MIGSIGEFPADQSDDFQDYLERFEQFCLANDIGESDNAAKKKKKAVFLSVIGASTYKLLKTLMAPDKPNDKSLKDITKALKEHLSPAPVVIGERFKFYQRRQGQGESIGDYMRELKRLIETCEFEKVTDQGRCDERLFCHWIK